MRRKQIIQNFVVANVVFCVFQLSAQNPQAPPLSLSCTVQSQFPSQRPGDIVVSSLREIQVIAKLSPVEYGEHSLKLEGRGQNSPHVSVNVSEIKGKQKIQERPTFIGSTPGFSLGTLYDSLHFTIPPDETKKQKEIKAYVDWLLTRDVKPNEVHLKEQLKKARLDYEKILGRAYISNRPGRYELYCEYSKDGMPPVRSTIVSFEVRFVGEFFDQPQYRE